MRFEHRPSILSVLLATLCLAVPAVLAQAPPEKGHEFHEKEYKHQDLDIDAVHAAVPQLPTFAAAETRLRLGSLGVSENTARIDERSGRFATMMPTTPLLPGRGVGNRLSWGALRMPAPASIADHRRVAWQAFEGYLQANRTELGLQIDELASDHRVTVHGDGDLYHVYVPRHFDGIPVRDSYITAAIGQGNLTLMSFHQWGDRSPDKDRRRITAADAFFAAEGFLAPLKVREEWGKPELVYIPMAAGTSLGNVEYRRGYRYQLVWAVKVHVKGDGGAWEVLVNAHTGEVLASLDTHHYAEAKGGVYPVTNDGVVPDGVEQPGWPMPFLNVSTSAGTQTTTTGGNLTASGSLTATLSGPYIRMNDNCGSISLTQTDNLDFGTSGGDDCVTPGFGGAGNTHSSRTGFYELNKIVEMARGQLPGNSWLQQRMTSNMNINQSCNAFWNGSTVNFYRSGGGCANTGEIAGVFDHEWGHGMDDNDAVPTIASPSGEGIADIYTALRLNDSCIGRNFRTTVCAGNGDPCLTCTGVRDIDYAKRQSGQPHDYSWSNANCGGSVHCVGGVYSEAVWSLWKRKLQAAPYNYDDNTAQEITTRLAYLGGGATGTWFSGGPPNGGCSGTSGYNNFLAADDDNGNLNDGTPHMGAIHAAFADQEIACNTPTVQDSGCSGTPSAAPAVTASSGNQSVGLSWGAIPGASEYEVFRTEGVFGCAFGKAKIADITGTSYTDTGLQNGRDYSYVVIPKGSSDACFGSASPCVTVQPAAAPDFSVSCDPGSASIEQGATSTSTCTVTAVSGFASSVALSCSGNPAGVSCGFSPASVSPTGTSTLTLSVDLAQATGTFGFDVVGSGGSLTRTAPVSVTVTPEGQNGPQTAVYDAGLGAPSCATAGSSCDSTTLLEGRGTVGPEQNQPNTLDTCTDGTAGTYQSDESNEGISVSTLDGFDFTAGATVRVDVRVWAWTTPSNESLDLYYAADANNPSWTFIATLQP
ncbi:MAG: PepSY domain-containing protein, partial [Acidobacteriota bacterium]